MWVRSLASLRGLRIWSCHKLWCRLQTQLGSGVAGAGAGPGSCSSNSKPSLGTSISHGCGPKKKKNVYIWNSNYLIRWKKLFNSFHHVLIKDILTKMYFYQFTTSSNSRRFFLVLDKLWILILSSFSMGVLLQQNSPQKDCWSPFFPRCAISIAMSLFACKNSNKLEQ